MDFINRFKNQNTRLGACGTRYGLYKGQEPPWIGWEGNRKFPEDAWLPGNSLGCLDNGLLSPAVTARAIRKQARFLSEGSSASPGGAWLLREACLSSVGLFVKVQRVLPGWGPSSQSCFVPPKTVSSHELNKHWFE